MQKRITTYIIIIFITVSTTISTYSANNTVSLNNTVFSDVKKTNWAYDAIIAMSSQGFISGYPGGYFKPENTTTYGEFIKMATIVGTGTDAGNAKAPDHWALHYYNKALELKYFTEHDIHLSELNNRITRRDMALIISSVLGYIKINNYDEIQREIKDINYKTQYEYDITKSYAAGILSGYPDNTFKPDKTLSRAESAMVIYRLADEIKLKDEISQEQPDTKEDPTILKRMRGESDHEIVNLIQSSTSTNSFKDKATSFDYPSSLRLKNVKYYEIMQDYPYRISKWIDLLGREDLLVNSIDLARSAVIINDGQVTSLDGTNDFDLKGQIFLVPNSPENYKLPYFDYIGFYNSGLDTIILVPNPFKE